MKAERERERMDKGETREKFKPMTADHDRTAVSRAFDTLDLTDKNVITFRTRHKNEKPLNVAVGFFCGEQYFESPQVTIAPKEWYENRIRIDGETFKCAANDYKNYDHELPVRDKIKSLVLVVYTKDAFAMEIDAIQISKEK